MDALITFLQGGSGLEAWVILLLCGVSFVGSFLTAALGLGGGVLAFATMAVFLPPVALIPLHGVLQLGSNGGRVALMYRHVLRGILPVFTAGTVLGAAAASQIVVALPTILLKAVLGTFILFTVWGPSFRASAPGNRTFFAVGAAAAFTTMFVGATGLLIAPFAIAAGKDRSQIVATHAAMMTIQHTLKIIAFGLLGFAFGPYWTFLAAMLVFGFFGTWLGKMALNKLPERLFRTGLKAILTVLALRLIYEAVAGGLS